MAKHFPFHKMARSMAQSGWGRGAPSEGDAMKNLVVSDAGAACLLEIVRRINQAIGAWAADGNAEDDEKEWPTPANAEKLPEAKIGDVYYACCDFEDGVSRYVCIGRNEDGYARFVYAHDDAKEMAYVSFAPRGFYKTAAEALADQAKKDVLWHAPRLDLARRVLAAVEAGADLSEFEGGVEIPDPDDDEAGPDDATDTEE